jgi:hypothetical protein
MPATSSLSATESARSSSHSSPSSYKGLGGGVQRNCTVTVVKAEKNITSKGKIELINYTDQMYIDLTPSNANIDYIQSEVQANWGTDYVVVSIKGLKIVDSAATRGKDVVHNYLCHKITLFF